MFNLAQGVSQQPDSLRYPGQCDEQVNAWATVVEGLVKRPNTNFVSKVSTSSGAGLFTHFVKRDEDNKYCVTVSLGGVGVIDLDSGNNISVATTSIATSYLSGITNPLADIRALTVADYTFLVNKKKEVKVDTNPHFLSKDIRDDNGKYNALVFVKMGDYEKTYDIILEGKEVPYGGAGHTSNKTPPGGHTYESGTSAQGVNADTEVIAEDLEIILNAYLGSDKIVAGLSMSGGSGFSPSQTRQGSTGSTVTYSFAIEQFEDDGSGNPDLDNKVGYGAAVHLLWVLTELYSLSKLHTKVQGTTTHKQHQVLTINPLYLLSPKTLILHFGLVLRLLEVEVVTRHPQVKRYTHLSLLLLALLCQPLVLPYLQVLVIQ